MPDEQSVRATITQLEDRRYSAMLAGDVPALDDLLSERLVYGHTRGNRDTKDAYLAKLASGQLSYEVIEHPIEQILVTDDAAVVIGQMSATARVDQRIVRMHNSSMAVWTLEGGHWRVVAYQATPVVT